MVSSTCVCHSFGSVFLHWTAAKGDSEKPCTSARAFFLAISIASSRVLGEFMGYLLSGREGGSVYLLISPYLLAFGAEKPDIVVWDELPLLIYVARPDLNYYILIWP